MTWLLGGCLAVVYLLGYVTAGVLCSSKQAELEETIARLAKENYDLKERIIHAKKKS